MSVLPPDVPTVKSADDFFAPASNNTPAIFTPPTFETVIH